MKYFGVKVWDGIRTFIKISISFLYLQVKIKRIPHKLLWSLIPNSIKSKLFFGGYSGSFSSIFDKKFCFPLLVLDGGGGEETSLWISLSIRELVFR